MCILSWNLGAQTSGNPQGLYRDSFTFTKSQLVKVEFQNGWYRVRISLAALAIPSPISFSSAPPGEFRNHIFKKAVSAAFLTVLNPPYVIKYGTGTWGIWYYTLLASTTRLCYNWDTRNNFWGVEWVQGIQYTFWWRAFCEYSNKLADSVKGIVWTWRLFTSLDPLHTSHATLRFLLKC
jgi:hypothetical protein